MTTRRDFCINACRTLSLATVAGFQGCGGSPTSPSTAAALPSLAGTVINGAVTVTIDAASPLAAVGSAALLQTAAGAFLVAHTAESAFTAVTAICTHETCTITGFENQAFVCPCHGSRFNTTGAVLTGPAAKSLQQFSTRFANSVLTIAV
jgi:cytochrome b6-f complex iron-sulfur subunit